MRRQGLSMKVKDSSSLVCQICNIQQYENSCYICKKRLCPSCICDNNKYCILCKNNFLDKSKDIVMRVPTKTGNTDFIVVKKSKCCFM